MLGVSGLPAPPLRSVSWGRIVCLTSNVSCTVTGAPCIKFGAPGIKLNLNGFIITGNGGRNSCASNFVENAIETNSKNNVSIQGPGLVRRFNGFGIVVTGDHSSVEGVAITSICAEGIRVFGSYNEVEGNSISRVSLDVTIPSHGFTGIFLGAPDNNLCEVSLVGPSPGQDICKLPNFAGHRNGPVDLN